MARHTPAKWRRNVCLALSIAVLVGLLVLLRPDGLGALAESLVIAVIIAAPYLVLAVTGEEVSAGVWWMTVTGLVVSTGYGLVGAMSDALVIVGSCSWCSCSFAWLRLASSAIALHRDLNPTVDCAAARLTSRSSDN